MTREHKRCRNWMCVALGFSAWSAMCLCCGAGTPTVQAFLCGLQLGLAVFWLALWKIT